MRRVLVIFLDGYEQSLGQRFMAAGEMPAMSRLAASSARFLLDHGPAQRTGLAGEHIATGLSPDAGQRWSAVHFDPGTYRVWQQGTQARPFPADLKCRTVVFDMPYFNLRAAHSVRGLVSWGAHDPGVSQMSRPSDLLADFTARFGLYPAPRWVYGLAWPSTENSQAMGAALANAVDVRADAAHWLLAERCPDWDLALICVSEPHSAIEGLWHGIDPTHPLHRVTGAALAGAGVQAVYRAVDRLIGKLTAAFPDAFTLVFAMGGMGVNRSDVPSMLLLPELLYRHAFGSAFFRQPPQWSLSAGRCPELPADASSWEQCIVAEFPTVPQPRLRGLVASTLPRPLTTLLRSALLRQKSQDDSFSLSLSWMPSMAYQPFWRNMPAFALPSFYDGRVRLNLIGREHKGIVKPIDYRRILASVEGLVRDCVDPATGESAVDFIEHPAPRDPRELPSTQADLIVVWKGATVCLEHVSLGRIGPVPFRRTGGHTGPFGMAFIRAADDIAGDHGIRSSYDVVPTILDLLGEGSDRLYSGTSLLSMLRDHGEASLRTGPPASAASGIHKQDIEASLTNARQHPR